jgi:uncharacterized metal-binding protein YceD (DUF177 family)
MVTQQNGRAEKDMEDMLCIYVDRLRHGARENIHDLLPPKMMEVEGDDIVCEEPIEVDIEAYSADGGIVLNVTAKTKIGMPCSVCNTTVPYDIHVRDYYHVLENHELKKAVFNAMPIVREAVLLELPSAVECNDGSCPERENMKKYLKKDNME